MNLYGIYAFFEDIGGIGRLKDRGGIMKKISDNKIRVIINSKPHAFGGLDSHKWASKMLVRNMLSGKPDLKINKSNLPHPKS